MFKVEFKGRSESVGTVLWRLGRASARKCVSVSYGGDVLENQRDESNRALISRFANKRVTNE